MSLRTRLDAALDYLEAHPEIPVVLTGGTGYGEEISEAACMYDYLTAHGVEPGRLILEDQASNTAENFALSKPLLYEAGVDPAEGRVAVVTNDFHIARSELIAAREGYGDVAGIPAPLPWVHLEINYTLREAFAMVKTFCLTERIRRNQMSDILCIYYSRTGEHQEGHGGDCRRPGRGAGGAAGQRGPERLAGLAALWAGRHAQRHPPRGPVGDSPSPGGLPLGDSGHTGVGRAIQRRHAVVSERPGRGDPQRGLCADPQQRLPVPGGLSPDGSLCARRSSGGGVLRSGDVGWAFWQEEFLRQVRAFLEGQ